MKKQILATLLLTSSILCRAQVIFNSLWDRGSSFTQQNTLFNDIDLSSYELLSANLSFTDKDQTQKVVLAPFRLTNNPAQFKFLVNTKVNLSLKDKITTFGIGFGGDNTSPYSRRANRIRTGIFTGIPAPGFDPRNLPPTLEQQLLRILNCEMTDPVRNRIFDSLGIRNCIDPEMLSVIFSIDSVKRRQLILDAFNKSVANVNHTLDSLLLVYDKAIARNAFKWTLGYNKQFFPNLFAQGTANNFDSLNHYNSKADNISISATYSYNNNQLVFTGAYNHIYAKSSAAKGQKMVPYYGPAFSASVRIFSFFKQAVLDTMAIYKKSLFVPSLNAGLSFEGKYADNASKYAPYYQDKIKRTVVWTPYLDILISPILQFRIALPIVRNTLTGDEKVTAAGANIQYNFKLSNLAQ